MVRASDVDVTVAIDRVPLLDGARETVALGIFSSLQPQNVRLRRAIRELETVAQASALPAAVRPADRRRPAGGGPARRGGALRRRAARGGLRLCRASSAFVTERSAALEPVTLDLTGERLADALAGPRPAGDGAYGSEQDAAADESVH